MELYFDEVWKKKLRQEGVSKISVEQIESNWRSYPYLYPIGDLAQESFHKSFHVCIDLINNELGVN
jgi:hypothetical protein